MKKLINYINNNVLIQVAQLNSITLSVKILAGLITTKAIAVFIGVEGMALIGNIRDFVSAVHSLSIMGLYKGVVNYISKFKNNTFRLAETISTAYYLGFFCTMIVAFCIYFSAESLNEFIFSTDYNYAYVFKVLALALPFYSVNMFCSAILNGFSKYKILLVINIIGQILGLMVTLVLIYQNNIDGALIAAVIAPSLIFLITLIGIINRKNLVYSVNIKSTNYNMLRRFSPFVVMAIISAVALPFVLILIRNYIIDQIGILDAGYWEAMNRISAYYLMFINSIMALYIVPKFSNIHDRKELKTEIISLYKTIIPIFAIGLLIIYFTKSLIIKLVLTENFLPTKELFLWQLLGDFMKILAMVISYQFIAKRMFLHFIIIQIFLVLTLYLSSVYFIDIYGVQGAVLGHFVSYLMQFGIILLLFNNSIFNVVGSNKSNDLD